MCRAIKRCTTTYCVFSLVPLKFYIVSDFQDRFEMTNGWPNDKHSVMCTKKLTILWVFKARNYYYYNLKQRSPHVAPKKFSSSYFFIKTSYMQKKWRVENCWSKTFKLLKRRQGKGNYKVWRNNQALVFSSREFQQAKLQLLNS